jgi:hypothetical protein
MKDSSSSSICHGRKKAFCRRLSVVFLRSSFVTGVTEGSLSSCVYKCKHGSSSVVVCLSVNGRREATLSSSVCLSMEEWRPLCRRLSFSGRSKESLSVVVHLSMEEGNPLFRRPSVNERTEESLSSSICHCISSSSVCQQKRPLNCRDDICVNIEGGGFRGSLMVVVI